MVQVLPVTEREKFGSQIGAGLGNIFSQGAETYMAMKQNAEKRLQEKQLAEQLQMDKISNRNAEQEFEENKLGKQLASSEKIAEANRRSKEDIAKLKGEKSKEPSEKDKEREIEIGKLHGALDTIKDMKNIRKEGNLGLFSRLDPTNKTRKQRGEYSRLGKSLISYSTSIPIRNRAEFEEFAHDLSDPNITDAKAEGILDGIEKIINRSLDSYPGARETMEMKDSQGNVYDIPKHKVEKAKSQGLK
jgi:hypothetical protein